MTTWAADAADIDVGQEMDKLVFSNDTVAKFLADDKKRFLSGNKGMGKTLLLSYKRYKLQTQYSAPQQRPNVRFVPSGKPYLDFMGSLPSLSKDWVAFLATFENAERLWSLALRLSALSHVDGVAPISQLPTQMREWIAQRACLSPTLVCQELFSLSISEFSRLCDRTHSSIEIATRAVQSGLYFFIDKVDQACDGLPKEVWINLQAGLLAAGAHMREANAHIKVYGTIRQEALANFECSTRANVTSAVSQLQYTPTELLAMLDNLTVCYEGKSTFKAFVGIDAIWNSRGNCNEDSYDYAYRHTVGRPRDLVRLAERVSSNKSHLTEERYKEIVNDTSAEIIGREVFAEVRVFLQCLASATGRAKLFRLLPGNILLREELERICKEYNELEHMPNFHADEIAHPFCELYKAGLLGVVTSSLKPEQELMRFRRPSDTLNQTSRDLPHSDTYFLHPGLQNLIRQTNPGYRIYLNVPVGDGYPWTSRTSAQIHAQMELAALNPNRRISEVTTRLLQVASHDGLQLIGDRTRIVDRDAKAEWLEFTEACEADIALTSLHGWVDAAIKGTAT